MSQGSPGRQSGQLTRAQSSIDVMYYTTQCMLCKAYIAIIHTNTAHIIIIIIIKAVNKNTTPLHGTSTATVMRIGLCY